VFCLEGGYAPLHVPFSGLAVLEELSGELTRVIDPILADAQTRPGQDLQSHQAGLLADIARTVLPLVPCNSNVPSQDLGSGNPSQD
jgi:hypothetical protein